MTLLELRNQIDSILHAESITGDEQIIVFGSNFNPIFIYSMAVPGVIVKEEVVMKNGFIGIMSHENYLKTTSEDTEKVYEHMQDLVDKTSKIFKHERRLQMKTISKLAAKQTKKTTKMAAKKSTKKS